MKNIDKINLIYLLLFFFGQNNFFLTHKLCLELGIGLGTYRSIILILFISSGTLLLVFNFLFHNYNTKFKKTEIIITCCIIIFIIGHLSLDYLKDKYIDFIGVASLIEGLFMLIYCSILLKPSISINNYIIKIISFLIYLNISLELFYYFNDLISGISYGPFRANIGGFTINRNPSFFYPIFAYLILKFLRLNKVVKLIYTLIFIIYIFSFFYRTIYVAILIPILFDKIIFQKINFKFSLVRLYKSLIFLIIIYVTLNLLNSYIEKSYNFSIFNIFIERFSSTGVNINDDPAQSQRIDQIPQMILEILTNPMGIGFNGSLIDGPVYLFAYYLLHPILYLGWFFIFVLYYYNKRYISIFKSIKINNQNRLIYISINYFLIVLVFFPYMSYFTFTSIIVLLFSISRINIFFK